MHCVVCSSSLIVPQVTHTSGPSLCSHSLVFSLLLSVFKIDIYLQGALATYTVVVL